MDGMAFNLLLQLQLLWPVKYAQLLMLPQLLSMAVQSLVPLVLEHAQGASLAGHLEQQVLVLQILLTALLWPHPQPAEQPVKVTQFLQQELYLLALPQEQHAQEDALQDQCCYTTDHALLEQQ